MSFVKELWQYREMIITLVKRDLKSRYKGSVLGFFWMFLNPLLQLIVYTIVFSGILRMGIEKFYLFLFVALIPWSFFSTCLSAGTTVVYGQKEIVKKIYFPREVLPIAFTLSQFINMLLSFIVVLVVIFLSGIDIVPKAYLYLPVLMVIEFVLALGITFLVSSLNVYLRDIEHILSIVSMAWMYLTPVLYPVELVPEKYMTVFRLNPMTPLIVAYREILYYGKCPEITGLLSALELSLIVLAVGMITFSVLQRRFAEEL